MNISTIGLIGDVHCEDLLLEKSIKYLSNKNPNIILCTGDIVDGTGDFDRCINLLNEFEINTVQGNHDEWFLTNSIQSPVENSNSDITNKNTLKYMQCLPKTLSFQTPIGELLLCHGLGENNMAKFTLDDFGYAIESNKDLQNLISEARYSIVVSGHTHKRMIRKYENCTFINAGSLISSFNPCFSYLDLTEKIIEFYLLDSTGRVVDSEIFEIRK